MTEATGAISPRGAARRSRNYRRKSGGRDQTASLRSLAARNATFLLALILIGSPVAGLRPMRAARLRTCRMPRPAMRMRSPFLRCLTRSPTRSLRIVSACFFGTSWVSARDAARCLMVTVVGVAAFAMVGRLPVLTHVVFGKTPNHARGIDTRFAAAGHGKNRYLSRKLVDNSDFGAAFCTPH